MIPSWLTEEAEAHNVNFSAILLTNRGGKGMVVKPLDFAATYKGQTIHPAVKCQGGEYSFAFQFSSHKYLQNLI